MRALDPPRSWALYYGINKKLIKEILQNALALRRQSPAADGFQAAAVLVPILAGAAPRLLLMERAAHEKDPHSGQISFPGGRREPGDADATATALREAEEELGLPPEAVEVLGTLEETFTPSGYRITPIVGWLERPPRLCPDSREVACCFEVLLSELADPGRRFSRGEREVAGRRFEVFEYRAAGRVIWGATARIAASLLESAGSALAP